MTPQPEPSPAANESSSGAATLAAGLALRSVGPALMGGRIADIAVHPKRPATWYVAVGSGGVWRTTNAGTTWTPLFDDQPSYSIGCVRIDPSRPEVIWVGTGEAVSGRHVAWGDGVYRSNDGGGSWSRMGLERSEHISEILIDPTDGDIVYVAAEGPLWSSGGERGLYKTTDGGRSWDCVLTIDEDTGVTSVAFAPDRPQMLYAAGYQRRRRAWSFHSGGPGSGIHVSSDGGQSWTRCTEGLPEGEMGRIGLAVTPADPDLVYATIEAVEPEEQGFYRSRDRGRTWERRNEYLSGGTGPHYYQELFASPVDADRVYQVDVFIHVTRDGGTTFTNLEQRGDKHSDNHVIRIDPDDPQHLLVGTDAGLYETYDHGGSWRHSSNLPISQFYRVAVDNAVPFTSVLAGAQDLGTLHGPTRTANIDGVRNQDWWVPLGADGYHVAFDPHEPDLSYLEWQNGNVMRHDRRTMELTDIQPQPGPGDPPERWSWDTPIKLSPHRAGRLYVASQRLWRSDDRGDSWTAISPDLTTDPQRYERATGERVISIDSLYDHAAMSWYGTITDCSESPVAEGVLYVGTDDGLIQVSEDEGDEWRRATRPPDLPEVAFINDVEASHHDGDTVYVAADDHKSGDYTPYLYRSTDRGRSWHSIRGDLPDGSIIWSIEQDHVEADLLFLGTETGLHVTVDGGRHWHRLAKDMPPIAVRDLALQRRDDDLVVATFGRGIYVLDDYSPLRAVTEEALSDPATLFGGRDAWWYVPYRPMQGRGQPTLGTSAYRAPNPPFGATFTYHLADDVHSAQDSRRAQERAAVEEGGAVEIPGWDQLWEEHVAPDPSLVLLIRDETGAAVRVLPAETKAGLHRTTWDLRHPPSEPIDLGPAGFEPPWSGERRGPLASPGPYTVELARADGVELETLSGPTGFEVRPVPGPVAGQVPAATGPSRPDAAPDHDFARETAGLARRVAGAAETVATARQRLRHLRAGVLATPAALPLLGRVDAAARRLEELGRDLEGDPVRRARNEPIVATVRELVERVARHHWDTTGGPTATQRAAVTWAASALGPLEEGLRTLVAVELEQLVAEADTAGMPWTPR